MHDTASRRIPVSASAAARWASALGEWAIPEEILAQAPAPPWVLPPALFRVGHESPDDPGRPSLEMARLALGDGGTVLDVGCGGGAASLPLAPPATSIVGFDQEPAMLSQFAGAFRRRGIPHRTVEGSWPPGAGAVEPADVVVCNHVVYNVAEIEPFILELSAKARRRVVVELTATHPTAPFNFLWQRFWGLDRPIEPTSSLFLEVLSELGLELEAQAFERPPAPHAISKEEYTAFVRQRLCLNQDRDHEVQAALEGQWPLGVGQLVAVSWSPAAS
ncbi:MAG TPA: class I SAM-dependent methyltransferase [Candidatus Dormibacteraeota bacterium]